MSLFRIAALLIMCGAAFSAVGKSATPQDSAAKKAAKPHDIPESIAESVSGTLQFAEGSFIGLAEAMPEDNFAPSSALTMPAEMMGVLLLRREWSRTSLRTSRILMH